MQKYTMQKAERIAELVREFVDSDETAKNKSDTLTEALLSEGDGVLDGE